MDRVKQTITAANNAAPSVTLGAAAANYRSALDAGAIGGTFPYLIEWSAGWEVGLGQLDVDNVTWLRTQVIASNGGGEVVGTVPGAGATFSICPLGQASVASRESGFPSAAAEGALAIGNARADQPGMRAMFNGQNGRYEWDLFRTTSNATPVDVFADLAGTQRPQVPAEQVWLVRAFVCAVVSNSPGSIGNCYSRELRALGKPTGQIGATVSTAIAADGGFTGSVTMSIDASGNIKVTLTGMAATTINWAVALDVTPTYASP